LYVLKPFIRLLSLSLSASDIPGRVNLNNFKAHLTRRLVFYIIEKPLALVFILPIL